LNSSTHQNNLVMDYKAPLQSNLVQDARTPVLQRDQSLDALRGFAILAMVLSGSIAFGDALPAWMFHAQVPPPKHVFIPTLAGISWVDLVFPFFLFSMGAAIPLSLSKLEKEGAGFFSVAGLAVRRFLLLAFFALFTMHMRAWVLDEKPSIWDQLISIGAFILLFFQLYSYPGKKYKAVFKIIRITAFVTGALLLWILPFKDGKGFQAERVDIIMLVLANMALFGTIIWWLTRKNMLFRIGLLPFIMAVFLASKENNSWNEDLFNYSPVPWLYKFYYLKYLFIIIPGTIAGDWLLAGQKKKLVDDSEVSQNGKTKAASVLAFVLVITNVIFLFERHLLLNLISSCILAALIYAIIRKANKTPDFLLNRFFNAGFYLLMLGIFFEAYEGGIKKDPSTYSYYFITSGLAFFMLIGFAGLQLFKPGAATAGYLGLCGRNPMVAYVAGNLLLFPLMHISGVMPVFSQMNDAMTGLLRGLIFTGIVSLITVYFVKRKWYWKT
jgi:predicted acyltransferase